ncbi:MULTISPECIES: hypothetical protein [Paenibacillus]|uniref:Uncharacterized protein n=1 Tax=Paenibacillus borealis TaxID=160799 RepID=A0ABX3H0M7_PAEBO|nr:hypothetical protein [Paenibacillus borealis]OMD39645.1 hypothetical protein BSK56_29440 [Paenibacillus borealis]
MSYIAASNGRATAEWSAYAHLVIGSRVQNEERGIKTSDTSKSMSFDDFMGAIQKGEQLNSYNARQISNDEILNNRIYEQHNGVSDESRFRFSTLQKAYELGPVDSTGVLTSSYRSKA